MDDAAMVEYAREVVKQYLSGLITDEDFVRALVAHFSVPV